MYITPCVSICQLKLDHQKQEMVCIGCGRTQDEIKDWTRMNENQRMVVMKRLGYGKRKKRINKRKANSS